MISPGATVVCNRTGAVLWVVKAPAPDGRWYLTGKQVVGSGRATYRGHVAGARDITVIRDAPTYEVGATVEHNGLPHIVAADNGDSVTLDIPASRFPLKRGGHLHIAAGNTTVIAKSDLVLEKLK